MKLSTYTQIFFLNFSISLNAADCFTLWQTVRVPVTLKNPITESVLKLSFDEDKNMFGLWKAMVLF